MSDDVGLSSCWYSNDSYSANTTLASCGTNITDVVWIEGQHNVTIWANDTSGNENYSRVSFTIDTTPPTFTTFANQTTVANTSFSYNINAIDAGTEVDCFTVNDTTNFNITCAGVLTNNIVFTNVTIYYLNITVNDSLNNQRSGIMWVNVTAVAPTSTLNWDWKALMPDSAAPDRICFNFRGGLQLCMDKAKGFMGNVTLANGGKVWDNSTCTMISSPDGSNVMEVCDT